MMLGQLRRRDRRHADRNVLDVFGALLRRDRDFLQLAGCRIGRRGGGRCDRRRVSCGAQCRQQKRENLRSARGNAPQK